MGLDIVELVMAVEAGFGVDIPNETASRMRTPRDIVHFLEDALPAGSTSTCLSQRAFYRLRMHCERRLGVQGRALTPGTPLGELVDGPRRDAWAAIGADLGIERWPAPRHFGWRGRTFQGPRPATLGQAARFAASWYPRSVKGFGSGWTTTEIERAVVTLIEVDAGVDMSRHTLDSSFVEDMNLD